LNKLLLLLILSLIFLVVFAEEKYNFDFLKAFVDTVADSTKIDSLSEKKTEYDFDFLDSLENENEESKASIQLETKTTESINTNPMIGTSEFWNEYVFDGSYILNFNYSTNLFRLFNRKDYNEEDFSYLTENCGFSQYENFYTSPDGKVSLKFQKDTKKYLKNIRMNFKESSDFEILQMDENITYDDFENIFGYQCLKTDLKMSFSVVAYADPDTTLVNRLMYNFNFNFNTDGKLNHLNIYPLLAEKINLNEMGEPKFLFFECLEGDCENGYGILRWTDGDYYKGTFSNGFPVNGIVYEYNLIYKCYAKSAEFESGELTSGICPTIFDPKTYMKPLLIKLHEAVDQQRKIKSARKDVDYYHYRMQTESYGFESNKQNMITYSERGIEYAKECKRITKQAYNILVDTDTGNCLDALFKLSEITNTLQDIEDVFWVLRHVAILNGEMDQAQVNVVTQWEYLFNKVNFDEVNRILENCGYYE